MMKPFSHQRYNYFYQCFLNVTLPLRCFWYDFIIRLCHPRPPPHFLVLSKIACCQSYFREFSKESPAKKKSVRIFTKPFPRGSTTIFGDASKTNPRFSWLTCVPLYRNFFGFTTRHLPSVYLAEASCPSLHAVALWKWVPGAGVHWRGRVWGSLQVREEAGWLLVRHKTFSPTTGRLCQWVSQLHVIPLPETIQTTFFKKIFFFFLNWSDLSVIFFF